MSEMVERACEAAWDEMDRSCHVSAMHDGLTDGCTAIDGDVDLRRVVCAVIQAMRKATEAMLRAGVVAHCGNDALLPEEFTSQVTEIWQAMIDEALKE